MQTGLVADRITTAGLAQARVLPTIAEQVYCDDLRIRSWQSADPEDGPTYVAPDDTYSIVSDSDFGDAIQKGATVWDLGFHDLGVNTPVELPDGSTQVAAVSSVALDAHTDLVCFYANHFRGSLLTGIWLMQVRDDGGGHLYWSDPQCIYPSLAVDELNGSSKLYLAFPRLTIVGAEFWITALECSKYAGHERYHLSVFQSKDGKHWSDRLFYLAGASLDSDQTLGIYKYDADTPFTRDDLLGAYLAVEDMFAYLLSPTAAKFVTDATVRCGVENPAKRLDLTSFRKSDGLSQSAAPSASSGTIALKNHFGTISANGDDDIVRRGARLTRKGGYRTTEGDELVTMSLEYIDEAPEAVSVTDDTITLSTRDGFKRLQAPDYKADAYFEYPGPQQAALENFCDFSAFMPDGNGSFRINAGARLVAEAIDDDSAYPDNLIIYNFDRDTDGVTEVWFKQSVTWVGHHVGVAFDLTDNQNYWALVYNLHDSGKFELRKVIPHPKKRSHRKIRYMSPVAASGSIALSTGHWWAVHLQFQHGHVQACYTDDGVTWTDVIDYVSPTDAGAEIVTSNVGYFGIIGCSTMDKSDPIGNTKAQTGPFEFCNSSARHDLALRIQTGAGRQYLHQIGVVLSQTNLPPDVTIGLLYDPDGTGANPPDATDEENVVFSKRIAVAEFADTTGGLIGWNGPNVDAGIRLHANTYYWVWVHFHKTPASGRTWSYYSEDPATNAYGVDLTRISDDDGATWGSLDDTSKNLAAGIIVLVDGGTARFRSGNVAYGRMPNTLEDVVKDVAAKAGILEARVDDCPDTALLGDCVVQVTGVTLSGLWRIGVRGDSGYTVEFNPATAHLKFYAAGSVLCEFPSLQYFEAGTPFDVALFHHKGAFYVYVNGCLATIAFDDSVTDVGFPTVSGDGTYDNFRVPDLTRIQDYYVLESDKDAATALQELTAKQQLTYFIDYAGRLRIGSFRERAVVCTFSETVQVQANTSNDDLWVSQRQPQSLNYATVYDAKLLDTDGRRFSHDDITNAFTDEDAYLDGEHAQRRMQELLETGTLEVHGAVPTIEREDRIQDGDGKDWIVNDVEFSRPDPAHFTMKLGVRRYVPFVPVAIIPTDTLTDDGGEIMTDDSGEVMTDG